MVDTWSGAPRVVSDAAGLLAGRYGYVSSSSVYVWGDHVDECSPTVAGDPQTTDGDHPALKRGAELGVLAAFPDALLARAGLILGPHEDIGRLPWWLLSGLDGGVTGPVDVISRSGHATTSQLLDACLQVTGSGARLVWIGEEDLAAAGVQPWTHLPCWVPERGDFAGFVEVDTTRAARTGLDCRPVIDTVADTWAWMQRGGLPPQRTDRDIHGPPPALERQLPPR